MILIVGVTAFFPLILEKKQLFTNINMKKAEKLENSEKYAKKYHYFFAYCMM
ncbi:hypothetical protein C806_02274 [Lachnospiraceae bacterium 3-1]|nr:hypothetical protein C806_02274 [Lachnospiraceae bacterium 3-1]